MIGLFFTVFGATLVTEAFPWGGHHTCGQRIEEMRAIQNGLSRSNSITTVASNLATRIMNTIEHTVEQSPIARESRTKQPVDHIISEAMNNFCAIQLKFIKHILKNPGFFSDSDTQLKSLANKILLVHDIHNFVLSLPVREVITIRTLTNEQLVTCHREFQAILIPVIPNTLGRMVPGNVPKAQAILDALISAIRRVLVNLQPQLETLRNEKLTYSSNNKDDRNAAYALRFAAKAKEFLSKIDAAIQ